MATPVAPIIVKLRCLYGDCLHEWWPRTDRKPQVCPACKRYDWDKPHPKSETRGGRKHVKKVHGPRNKETAIDRFRHQMDEHIRKL